VIDVMQAGFLSLMRGPDGRRLNIVLAAMLAIAALIASVSAGFAAGGETGVICRADASGKNSPAPLPATDHFACCIAGHNAVPGASPPERTVLVLPRAAGLMLPPPLDAKSVVVRLTLASEGPRGPPLQV
jgi:hypothetical protein